MNKKTKGFTLIELLAIIVILAIIAVITVPIILNVIDNAKKGTAKDSAYGYKDAISKYYVSGMLEDKTTTLNGNYIVSDGKLGEYDIPFSGTKPTSGYLTYSNNVLTSGCLTVNDYKIEFENGEVKSLDLGKCTRTKGYTCRRATTLHTEECKNFDSENPTYYCSGAGYTTEGKGTTITYGNLGSRETLTIGDAFDCDVNGDGIYNVDNERFYYVIDVYNTNTKEFNNDYALLIYYNNTTNGIPDNTTNSLTRYNIDGKNYEGPVTAITNLPKTKEWKNVSLIDSKRAILNQFNEPTSNNGANTLPNDFSYEGYAARLINTQEMIEAFNVNIGSYTEAELDNYIFLMENTTFSNSELGSMGYWTDISHARTAESVWTVVSNKRQMSSNSASHSKSYAVRPVIEVPKIDIEI